MSAFPVLRAASVKSREGKERLDPCHEAPPIWMDGRTAGQALRCVKEKYNRRPLTQPNCLISPVYPRKRIVLGRLDRH